MINNQHYWSQFSWFFTDLNYWYDTFYHLAYVQPQEYEQQSPNQSPRQRSHPTAPSDLFQIQVEGLRRPHRSRRHSRRSVENYRVNNNDSMTCTVCLDQPKEMLFRPCGHVATCQQCAESLSTCPLCRARIDEKIRTYL